MNSGKLRTAQLSLDQTADPQIYEKNQMTVLKPLSLKVVYYAAIDNKLIQERRVTGLVKRHSKG